MVEISVLMSVFNENSDDLKKSIDSVLMQNFHDFEFIIVNDNPKNANLRFILEEYQKEDDRIKLITNKKNIGLALSLNRAAEDAQGKYILRTDADDICVQGRFKKQYEVAEENNYDLVCSNYHFINEDNQLLTRKVYFYDAKSIHYLLPIHNVIHHPTVLMRTSSFKEVGGYRNFLCAQDYDLWLRMLLNNCQFYMLKEKLLFYRVRENSITGKNKLKQIYTLEYIRKCYKYQKKHKNYIYDYDEYLSFLEMKRANDVSNNQKFNEYFERYHNGIKKLANKDYLKGIQDIIFVIISSTYYRNSIFNKVKFQIMKKIL